MNAQVIALVNQKGGMRKSTSCVNLGVGLTRLEEGPAGGQWPPGQSYHQPG